MNAIPEDLVYVFDTVRFDYIESIARRHYVVRECIDFIIGVTTTGLRLEGASATISSYVEQVLLPFIRTILRSSVLCGWSQFKIIKDIFNEEAVLKPVMVPFSYTKPRLVIPYKTCSPKLFFTPPTTDKLVAFSSYEQSKTTSTSLYAFMFHDMFSFMNENMMNSPFDTFVDEYSLHIARKRASAHADLLRSNPSVYLNPRDNEKKLGSADLFNTGDGGTCGLQMIRPAIQPKRGSEEWKRLAEAAEQDIQANITFHEEQAMRRKYTMNDPTSQQFENNLFIPPPNKVLVALPHMPEPVHNLIESEQLLNTSIYKAFGLSRLGAEMTNHSKMGVDFHARDLETLELTNTLERYRDYVIYIITVIYGLVFNHPFKGKVHIQAFNDFIRELEKSNNPELHNTRPS